MIRNSRYPQSSSLAQSESSSGKSDAKGCYYYYVYRKKIDPNEINDLPRIFPYHGGSFELKPIRSAGNSPIRNPETQDFANRDDKDRPIKSSSPVAGKKQKPKLKRNNSLPELSQIQNSNPEKRKRSGKIKLKPIKAKTKTLKGGKNAGNEPQLNTQKLETKKPQLSPKSPKKEFSAKNPIAAFLLKLKPEEGLQWSRHTTISKGPLGVTEKTLLIETRKILKDNKWVEETIRTESLTDERGTRTKSRKVSFQDLPWSEIGQEDMTPKEPAPLVEQGNAPQQKKTTQSINTRSSQPIRDDSAAFSSQALNATNSYRKIHGVAPLKLNSKLSDMAKEWANKLAKMEKMEHGKKKDIGENIYCKTSSQPWFEVTGEEVIGNWYSEIEDHVFDEEPSEGFLKAGHFTQLVWKSTEKMGIAFSRNKNGHMAFVVAYFFPKGNWIGEFRRNVIKPGGTQISEPKKTIQNSHSKSHSDVKSKKSNSSNKLETINDNKQAEANSIKGSKPKHTNKTKKKTRQKVKPTQPDYNTTSPIYETLPSARGFETDSQRDSTTSKKRSDTNYSAPNSIRQPDSHSARSHRRLYNNYTSQSVTPSPNSVHSSQRHAQSERNSSISNASFRTQSIYNGDFNNESIYLLGEFMSRNFHNECLEAHNYYREKHGVQPLTLTDELNSYAQEWADVLAEKDITEHRQENEFGENIYRKWSPDPYYKIKGDEAVESWYEEIDDYEFRKEPLDMTAGHFTQVIWADTEELGVGVSKSASGNIFVVANYEPPGNYIGLFSKMVHPPI